MEKIAELIEKIVKVLSDDIDNQKLSLEYLEHLRELLNILFCLTKNDY